MFHSGLGLGVDRSGVRRGVSGPSNEELLLGACLRREGDVWRVGELAWLGRAHSVAE